MISEEKLVTSFWSEIYIASHYDGKPAFIKCYRCKFSPKDLTYSKFCPNCGAKMEAKHYGGIY